MKPFYRLFIGKWVKQIIQKKKKNLWCLLVQKAPELSEVGFTAVWLPPANKAMGGKRDVGYATYDLWD